MCLLMSIHGPSATAALGRILSSPDAPPFELPTYLIASAFDHPAWPVALAPGTGVLARWGLVPSWVKTRSEALAIRKKTANARAETLFELPSFREAARRGRCAIVVDGFYEYHRSGAASIPFYCHLTGHRPFFLAGVSSAWSDPETGEAIDSFAVVTTRANPLMALVHNEKKRMPVMLGEEEAKEWILAEPASERLRDLTASRAVPGLRAHPVSRDVGRSARRADARGIQEPVDYPELSGLLAELRSLEEPDRA